MSDDKLTHTDQQGFIQMVDVGDKESSIRRAVASGEIHLSRETIETVRKDELSKGDVLSAARISAIQAVKHTWETIPMCHQIPITNIALEIDIDPTMITLTVTVETIGKTGCEMEALQGVTTGLNTVWDMTKALEKDEAGEYPKTTIENIQIIQKTVNAL